MNNDQIAALANEQILECYRNLDQPQARLIDEAITAFVHLITEHVATDTSASAGAAPPPVYPPDKNKPPAADAGAVEGEQFNTADDDHPQDQQGLVVGEELGSIKHIDEEPGIGLAELRERAREALENVPLGKASEVCGVSEPTLRNLLDPMSKPWPKTLKKLSDGLNRMGY